MCGLRHEGTQKRLLAERELTFTKARDIALGVEAAEKNLKEVRNVATPKCIQKIKVTTSVNCKHCGRSNHSYKECRFRDAICYNCKHSGHIAGVCKIPKKEEQSTRQNWIIKEEEDLLKWIAVRQLNR